MKRELSKIFIRSIVVAIIGFLSASSVQGQVEREMFMVSYPNASIEVDGDPSDWNLDQFETVIVGGVNPFPDDHLDWERNTGTGDIAQLGWDDAGENLVYGGMWANGKLPETPEDNSVKFYARDNDTHQYFFVDITDDEVNAGDEAAWANDSVEFYFDPENDGDPTDWNFDVQLVIDSENQVQVWNSPPEYETQVEAGVTSAVTLTETGWMLEVGIDKTVFDTPLPAVLGAANDPDGNNYGIDFSYRDNDDPSEVGTRGGDTEFTSAYVWADSFTGTGFPSKLASSWGQMIAGAAPVSLCNPETGGDLNGDLRVDFSDFLVLSANFGTEVEGHGQGDINCNGTVDFPDFLVMSANFGSDVVAASVPEPSSVAMLFLGFAMAGLRLRRRI